MSREFSRAFYKSKSWKVCREGFIASVNGLCTRCLEKGKITPGYIVHHKKWLTPENIDNPEITLNWDNLEYLCIDCHNAEHLGLQNIPRWMIVDGEIVER